jgi:hypothetical protein
MSLKHKDEPILKTQTVFIAVLCGLLGGVLGALLALLPVWFSAQLTGDKGTMLFLIAVLATIFFAWMGIALGGYLGWRLSR